MGESEMENREEEQAPVPADVGRKQFQIIWPERRTISAAQIELWYIDATANGDIDHDHFTVEAKAVALDDAGYITLGSLT
jgi:hypothetical protein